MLWDGSDKTLHVYLSNRGFAICHHSKLLKLQTGSSALDVLDALTLCLKEHHPGARVSIRLSGALCRPFLTKLPIGLSNEERGAALLAAGSKKTGLSGPLTVWCDQSDRLGGVIGAAVEDALIERLRTLPRALPGLKVESLGALWADWLKNRLVSTPTAPSKSNLQHRAIVLLEPDSVTLLAGPDQGFSMARSIAVAQSTEAETALTRLLLTSEVTLEPLSRARVNLEEPLPASGLGLPLSPIMELLT